jgi:hypothetical protein
MRRSQLTFQKKHVKGRVKQFVFSLLLEVQSISIDHSAIQDGRVTAARAEAAAFDADSNGPGAPYH